MDLLVEKLDGSRYYLSQYKVLITEFEESAPSVTRNSKQLDQRNGNIDFGGWHTNKTINITGYYRADDMDEEEMLREKLYALLSDPDGYYITQLKTTPSIAMERPGETSGGYYDKLKDYPSHKRFLVYTEAPEMELVGNVGGTLLYKLTAEFKTIKLPYGESVPQDLDVKPNVPYIGRNLYLNSKSIEDGYGTNNVVKVTVEPFDSTTNMWHIVAEQGIGGDLGIYFFNYANGKLPDNSDWSYSADVKGTGKIEKFGIEDSNRNPVIGTVGTEWSRISQTGRLDKPSFKTLVMYFDTTSSPVDAYIKLPKLEIGKMPTPWSPAPEDPGYNKWYLDTYYNTDNLFIPYSGTVPCNQLEQGFAIEMTAKGASSSLSFKINDTELTYSGSVASGDVFLFTGFSYTQNGLSIVSKTNKAYFILQPDKPNRITCNVLGTVRILGFQNLYA